MSTLRNRLLIHGWVVFKAGEKYFLPYTQWIYLSIIKLYFDNIVLISPISVANEELIKKMYCIDDIGDNGEIEVYSLPYHDGYVKSIKFFFSYLKAYRTLKNLDYSYVRFPTPFGWLQKFFFPRDKRIIHFVGDPMDAALYNPNFSFLKKIILITFFLPEFLLYMWACKNSTVFTNGFHIAKKLNRFGIKANPLISSTLEEKDFFYNDNKIINKIAPKLLYVGYLRTAKGVEIIIDAFEKLKSKYPDSSLTLVGSGDFEKQLKIRVKSKSLNNVNFLGHIDSREELNQLYRSHDIFCFASLSEGSPRVIIEAMANNINVISTPVGSLPYVFEDNGNIVFIEFNNSLDLYKKIELLIEDDVMAKRLRDSALAIVKNYTIRNFIDEIFGKNIDSN